MAENTLLWLRNSRITFAEKGKTGKAIEGMHVKFDIVKSLEKNANTCKLTVYNLSPESRATLEKKNVNFTLETAYGATPRWEVLFSGNITKATSTKEGASWVTEVESGDGINDLTTVKVSKSYTSPISLKQVAKDIMKEFPNIQSANLDQITDVVTKRGFSLDKLGVNALEEISARLGAQMSVQDGKFVILPPDKTSNAVAIVISSSTGLVGSPIKADKGIELTALINSAVKPTSYIQVISNNFNGFYKVTKAQFQGSTYENEWYMKLNALPREAKLA